MRSIVIIFFMLVHSFCTCVVFAAENEENEAQKQYRRYEDIQKTHDRNYKKGLYSDEKKDYLDKSLSEDINYQKRVIKLKSDYRSWGIERQEAGKAVIFNEYEPLKKLTAAEKGILYEYHTKVFGNTVKKSAVRQKKREPRKLSYPAVKVNKIAEDDAQVLKKEVQADASASYRIESGINLSTYIIIGLAAVLIIAECVYLIIKRRKYSLFSRNVDSGK